MAAVALQTAGRGRALPWRFALAVGTVAVIGAGLLLFLLWGLSGDKTAANHSEGAQQKSVAPEPDDANTAKPQPAAKSDTSKAEKPAADPPKQPSSESSEEKPSAAEGAANETPAAPHWPSKPDQPRSGGQQGPAAKQPPPLVVDPDPEQPGLEELIESSKHAVPGRSAQPRRRS